jgi:hypothetical protein
MGFKSLHFFPTSGLADFRSFLLLLPENCSENQDKGYPANAHYKQDFGRDLFYGVHGRLCSGVKVFGCSSCSIGKGENDVLASTPNSLI